MTRSRASFLAEMLLLGAICLALLFWIIPAQTSEGGFGLSPAFLPDILAAAILLLVLADGVSRLRNHRVEGAYPTGVGALARVLAVAGFGALVLTYAGVAASAAATPAAGMLALGERRPLPILATAALLGGVFWLVFR
ncbi:hypothetical protein [Bosea minatitlanensis]|uniref:Tripartite tricarboxylate transporter TctB family protein n=1 Tax=Bosea minatitlanensis TaxID=128782 RepID=A0ABW0F0K6_9HYPH|nr:hypothetical protein [Bosea minatitlanensis]MCT4491699.1 hypothetical protein [Bosea minatitlanensis]